jgi:type IV secretory pathway TrbD component
MIQELLTLFTSNRLLAIAAGVLVVIAANENRTWIADNARNGGSVVVGVSDSESLWTAAKYGVLLGGGWLVGRRFAAVFGNDPGSVASTVVDAVLGVIPVV